MGTLLSSRLKHYYKSIVTDLDRTMLGYELMKQLNRNVEDEVEGEYFDLLQQTFQTLDDENMPTELAQLWFQTQLLRLDGKVPNLHTDVSGEQLKLTQQYTFSYDQMTFEQDENGMFDASHIKFLRLSFSQTSPKILSQITALEAMLQACTPLVKNMAAW
jgi:recombinational DNA repair protein (RecF pathway)